MNIGQWIGLIALILCLYILWEIRDVLLLLFAAVVLATILNRLARSLKRFGLTRGLSVTLALTIFFAGIIGFFLLIVPPFTNQFQELTNKVPQGLERLNIWIDALKTHIPSQLQEYIPDLTT